MNTQKYSLDVNGITVFFETHREREEYQKFELEFTISELVAYHSALSLNDRVNAKVKLDQARGDAHGAWLKKRGK